MIETNQFTGLYGLFLKRLNEISQEGNRDIIPFPDVFEKLCRNFSMTKQQCWEILFLLRDVGVLEIVTLHGIKIRI